MHKNTGTLFLCTHVSAGLSLAQHKRELLQRTVRSGLRASSFSARLLYKTMSGSRYLRTIRVSPSYGRAGFKLNFPVQRSVVLIAPKVSTRVAEHIIKASPHLRQVIGPRFMLETFQGKYNPVPVRYTAAAHIAGWDPNNLQDLPVAHVVPGSGLQYSSTYADPHTTAGEEQDELLL